MSIRLNLDLDKYKGLTDNIMDKAVSDFSARIAKEKDLYLEYMFRCCVKPKIKGEITPGKIKWRGLTLSKKIDPEFPMMAVQVSSLCLCNYFKGASLCHLIQLRSMHGRVGRMVWMRCGKIELNSLNICKEKNS